MSKEKISASKLVGDGLMQHRVLVLGASGMLGNAVCRVFGLDSAFEVIGTVRSAAPAALARLGVTIASGVDVENVDSLTAVLVRFKPTIVINCVGLVKQLDVGNSVLSAVPINSILPHRLAQLCQLVDARLIHLSTDCVFSGSKGAYTEADMPDAYDVYGRSKLLGEVDYPNAVTLRTSIIGHSIIPGPGLIDWFLSQKNSVNGFTKAFFSGLPTIELANVIKSHVIPNPELHGVYHVSANRISKFELLKLVAEVYRKDIQINPTESLAIDRSLDSSRFKEKTGYQPPEWPELIQRMHQYHRSM